MSLLTKITVQVNPPVLVPSVVSPPPPVAPAGDIVLIDSDTLTNVTELVLTGLSTDYLKYVLYFNGAAAVGSTGTSLVAQVSTNNGSSFNSSTDAYIYRLQRSSGSNGVAQNFTGTSTSAYLIDGLCNTSGDFVSGFIEIFDPADSGSRTTFLTSSGGRVNADSNDANMNVQEVMGQREAAESNNAVRIFAVNGNFSMKYSLYGYK